MAKRVGADKWLFGTVLALVLFGLVMIFSTSAVMAKEQFGSPYRFVLNQAVFVVLGIVALFILMKVDYRHYNNPKVVFPLVAVSAVLLLSVFFMGGMNGAHRWVRVGSSDAATFGTGKTFDCAVSGVFSSEPHSSDR